MVGVRREREIIKCGRGDWGYSVRRPPLFSFFLFASLLSLSLYASSYFSLSRSDSFLCLRASLLTSHSTIPSTCPHLTFSFLCNSAHHAWIIIPLPSPNCTNKPMLFLIDNDKVLSSTIKSVGTWNTSLTFFSSYVNS